MVTCLDFLKNGFDFKDFDFAATGSFVTTKRAASILSTTKDSAKNQNILICAVVYYIFKLAKCRKTNPCHRLPAKES
jgi:hypothetical protein